MTLWRISARHQLPHNPRRRNALPEAFDDTMSIRFIIAAGGLVCPTFESLLSAAEVALSGSDGTNLEGRQGCRRPQNGRSPSPADGPARRRRSQAGRSPSPRGKGNVDRSRRSLLRLRRIGVRALVALTLILPLILSLSKGAAPTLAIPGCASPFTTAGEFTCVVPANATSVTITATGGAGAVVPGTPASASSASASPPACCSSARP